MPSIRKNITFLPVHFSFAKEYAINDDESGTATRLNAIIIIVHLRPLKYASGFALLPSTVLS